MANVYAIASGNWSNTAIWNTGALPTTADDVFSNNFTVTVDQNITVLSLRNTASAPIVAGGGFTWSSGGFTASITGATPLAAGATNLLIFSHATGANTVTLTNDTSAFFGGGNTINYTGNGNLILTCPNFNIPINAGSTNYILKSGTGSLTINGNLAITAGGQSNVILLNQSVGGNVTINGNLSSQSANGGTVVLRCLGSGLITINGNLLAGVGYIVSTATPIVVNGDVNGGTGGVSNIFGIFCTNASSVTVTGNVYGSVGPAINTTTATTITVTGNVTAGASSAGINTTGANLITVNGNVTASTAASGIAVTSTSAIVVVNGNMTSAANGRLAVWSPRLFTGTNANTITLYTIGSLTPKILYSQDAFPNAPAAGDVREGITYGVGGTLVGTLAMPSPSDVRSGVATDATVGTADLTTASIFSAISAATTGVGKRLANVATVQSDGAIIAAFKP